MELKRFKAIYRRALLEVISIANLWVYLVVDQCCFLWRERNVSLRSLYWWFLRITVCLLQSGIPGNLHLVVLCSLYVCYLLGTGTLLCGSSYVRSLWNLYSTVSWQIAFDGNLRFSFEGQFDHNRHNRTRKLWFFRQLHSTNTSHDSSAEDVSEQRLTLLWRCQNVSPSNLFICRIAYCFIINNKLFLEIIYWV